MAEARVIKKYPNRRLYDTELSRYITLADLRDRVVEGVDFVVQDANSGEDITRSILLQIITEQEAEGKPMFTADILMQMIRSYGGSAQDVFTDYLSKSLDLFAQQQRLLQSQLRNMPSDPMGAWSEMAKRNLEIWRDVQESFLKSAGLGPRKGGKGKGKRGSDEGGA